MKKKKKTTATRPSRLGGQTGHIPQDSIGILNYFDIHKDKIDEQSAEDAVVLLDESLEQQTRAQPITPGVHPAVKSGHGEHLLKENNQYAHNKRVERVCAENHENMLLVEEYGQCCSQDILLGNVGGKVVWNASPRSGFLSTEKKRFSTSPSPGERKDDIRRRKIEPVVLPQECMGDDVDGVLNALSTALANNKQQEGLDASASSPKGSVALGALRQCCSALQSKLSGSSSKKKKNGTSLRSSLTVVEEKAITNTIDVEIKVKNEHVCCEKKSTEKTEKQGYIGWGDDSDVDDEDLSNMLVALDNAASGKGREVPSKEENTLIRCVQCEVVSCHPDSGGLALVLRKRYGSLIYAHLLSPWDNGDYRQGDPINLVNIEEYLVDNEVHCKIGGMENAGFLIHHPEILLGGTRVTSSSECPRRGYLSERMTGEGAAMEAAVKGIMFHQLMQQSLAFNYRRSSQLKTIIEEIVASMPEQLLDSELRAEDASRWLHASIPSTLRYGEIIPSWYLYVIF